MVVVIDQYIVVTFLASFIGFLLWVLHYVKKDAGKYKTQHGKLVQSSGGKGDSSVENGVGIDVIIVGAGVAGAALAYTLGKDGRRVHVIERDLTEPDRIVGELLQIGGYLKLLELGLEDCVEEIEAQRLTGYVMFMDKKYAKAPFSTTKIKGDVTARSFHNGRFIQRLRQKAATLPNVILEQGTVTSLLEENGTVKGVQYKTKDGQELQAYAPLTFVCDGSFSNLRRSLCKSKFDVPSYSVALVLENCKLPFENHAHFVVGDASIILMYRISNTEVRCLVDVNGQQLPSIANGEMAIFLKTKVVPDVPDELRGAFVSAVEKGNIRTAPNRTMAADPKPTPGAFLLGDALNMRHSLTGGGMTVALSDIVVLRNLLRPLHDFHDTASLTKYLESFYTLRKPVSSIINISADTAYKLLSPPLDEARKEMCQIMFDYVSLGGFCSSGPMDLISGLNPQPLNMAFHIICMALYGAGHLLLPFPSIKRIWIGARALLSVTSIAFPIIKAQGVRQTFFPATVPAIYRAPPG